MNRMSRLRSGVALLALACAGSFTAHAQEVDVEFGFNSKPPLFYFETGQAQGDVVNIVRQACRTAGLRCSYTELPFQRALGYLEERRPRFAALGFSRTPERERYVNFSEPVWRDSTPLLLVRAGDKKKFQEYASLREMMDRSRYTFGGKAGNVYPIDSFLKDLGPREVRVNAEAQRFPLLLVLGRFDFTILYPEEILPALQASGVAPQMVATVSYPDIPQGAERYLLFSQAVPRDTVAKMNAALKSLRAAGQIHTLR